MPESLESIFITDKLNIDLYNSKYLSDDEVIIDMSNTRFTYPFGMVSLLMGLENLSREKKVLVDFNRVPNAFYLILSE